MAFQSHPHDPKPFNFYTLETVGEKKKPQHDCIRITNDITALKNSSTTDTAEIRFKKIRVLKTYLVGAQFTVALLLLMLLLLTGQTRNS